MSLVTQGLGSGGVVEVTVGTIGILQSEIMTATLVSDVFVATLIEDN